MKLLKPFLCVLFLSATCISCDKEDEGDKRSPEEKIIGTWQLSKLVEDGDEFELTTCEKQSTIVFSENGTLISKSFYEINEEGDCEEETVNGQWGYIDGNEFSVTTFGETETFKINFSENGNAMTIVFEYEEEGEIVFVDEYTYIKIG